MIVPTVALAIEQADDMQKLLRGADQDHGGSYVWIGGQDQPSRQAIKERIKAGTQRVLFCSQNPFALLWFRCCLSFPD